MTILARIISASTYLCWIPASLALVNPPNGRWCELVHVELLFGRLFTAPILVLLLGLLCFWGRFERAHWRQALAISFAHSVLSLTILMAGMCICIIPILGALIGIVLVFVVLPVWLAAGWFVQLVLGVRALAGREPIASLQSFRELF